VSGLITSGLLRSIVPGRHGPYAGALGSYQSNSGLLGIDPELIADATIDAVTCRWLIEA